MRTTVFSIHEGNWCVADYEFYFALLCKSLYCRLQNIHHSLFLCVSSVMHHISRLSKSSIAAWCGAGADHYEPLIATVLQHVTPDKAALVL
jgi:hypothetical protein